MSKENNNNPFGRRITPTKSTVSQPNEHQPMYSANFGVNVTETKHSTMTTNHTNTPVKKGSQRVSPAVSQTSRTEQKSPLRTPYSQKTTSDRYNKLSTTSTKGNNLLSTPKRKQLTTTTKSISRPKNDS